MKISQDKIEEIKNANDIVEVIGSYVRLIRRGRNYLGLCPFHQEKTPSFTVSPDKQIFHCFGCHAGGNVFSFIQQYEKVNFIDAVKKLAERAGIPIIFQEESLEKDREREQFYVLNEFAANYFQNILFSDLGKIGKEYFLSRDITEETINKFKLGFSLNSFDHFVNYSQKQKIDLEKLFKIGLIGKREDGSFFDVFRGRIIFPITNTYGKIVGFGARKLFENDDSGKYINSKESLIYNKSKILYGLSFSKEEIRKSDFAILVEGYMDFLTLYQNGIKNIVASSGTAITDDQVKILKRYTKNILFLYDADLAGMKATVRGLDIVLENDFDVKIIALENNEDPDSFVRKYGIEKFKYMVDNSVSFIKFISDTYKKIGKLNNTVDKVNSLREIFTILSKVKDKLKLEFYLKEVAECFDINEGIVRQEFEITFNKYSKKNIRTIITKEVKNIQPPEKRKIVNNIILPTTEEEDIIALIIMEGKVILDYVLENINEIELVSPYTKKILELLTELISKGITLNEDVILSEIEDPIISGIISKLFLEKKIVSRDEVISKYEDLETSRIKWIKDVVKRIKIRYIDSELERIKHEIRKTEEDNNDPTNLVQQFNNLHSQKLSLLNS
ncbi:MAG TPA: DNA primase [Bacteroidota bacterium]|nr:DNA primase [Bacteroidota bacterium]